MDTVNWKPKEIVIVYVCPGCEEIEGNYVTNTFDQIFNAIPLNRSILFSYLSTQVCFKCHYNLQD